MRPAPRSIRGTYLLVQFGNARLGVLDDPVRSDDGVLIAGEV